MHQRRPTCPIYLMGAAVGDDNVGGDIVTGLETCVLRILRGGTPSRLGPMIELFRSWAVDGCRSTMVFAAKGCSRTTSRLALPCSWGISGTAAGPHARRWRGDSCSNCCSDQAAATGTAGSGCPGGAALPGKRAECLRSGPCIDDAKLPRWRPCLGCGRRCQAGATHGPLSRGQQCRSLRSSPHGRSCLCRPRNGPRTGSPGTGREGSGDSKLVCIHCVPPWRAPAGILGTRPNPRARHPLLSHGVHTGCAW
mmetsp:Transcript_10580/g.28037  ORF Transcript_10580/g.28037 Transcript_10580/m.28037 type:complete len:252 (-) Transcript_10580:1089-1844(-)